LNILAVLEGLARKLVILGPIGIFLASLLGNAVPYATVPYLVIIVQYFAAIKHTFLDIIIVAIMGGLGAAMGKIIVYSIGRAARYALSQETKENLRLFTKLMGKSVFIAIFLFAALPLPDDVLYVPLGVSGYSLMKFFIACSLGKIIITFLAAMLGAIWAQVMEITKIPIWISLPSALIVSIIITYVITAINWVKVLESVESKGWLGFIINVVRNPKMYIREKKESAG